MNYYKEYTDVDLSNLKDWERQAIEIFKDAVKVCGDIYDKQKNSNCPGGNFYPCEISKEQLETFAKENPEIFSPYTMVEIDQMGKISAVKYSQKFEKEIAQISEAIEKAAPLYEQNGFSLYSSYLRQLSKDLKNDSYEESEKIWLKIDWKVNVDIKLGPIETYQDKLFGIKRAFQANLRITDKQYQGELEGFISVAKAILPSEKDGAKDDFILKVRTDKVIAMGGWHADFVPRTSSYPRDELVSKEGIRILVYTNNIISKQAMHKKIIDEFLGLDFEFNEQKFGETLIRLAMLHEVAETVSKSNHQGARNKIGGQADAVFEAHADLAGIEIASIQVLKGVLTATEYKFLVIAFIARILRGWAFRKKGEYALSAYGDGHQMILNYLLRKGGLIFTENNSIELDFQLIFTGIDLLIKELSVLITEADANKIQEFFLEYAKDSKNLEMIQDKLFKIVFED